MNSSLTTIWTLAQKELRDALRNRWFLLYTVAFAVLALAFSYLALAGAGMVGFAGFGRTAASLINLVLLIMPLMALTIGARAWPVRWSAAPWPICWPSPWAASRSSWASTWAWR